MLNVEKSSTALIEKRSCDFEDENNFKEVYFIKLKLACLLVSPPHLKAWYVLHIWLVKQQVVKCQTSRPEAWKYFEYMRKKTHPNHPSIHPPIRCTVWIYGQSITSSETIIRLSNTLKSYLYVNVHYENKNHSGSLTEENHQTTDICFCVLFHPGSH